VLDAVANCSVHDWIPVGLVWNRDTVALEQVLIHAAILVENLQRGFEAFREIVECGRIQAFVVNSFDAENETCVSRLGQENVIVNEAEEVDLLIERAGFAVGFLNAV